MISEDHCVYVKRSAGEIMFLTLYADDILLAGNNLEMIKATKKWLSSVFEMKDMGEARYVLGVDRTKKHLGMSQETYIKKVLEWFRVHYSKLIETLVEKGLTLSLDQCPKTDKEKEAMSNVSYTSAVRSLMYAMLYT